MKARPTIGTCVELGFERADPVAHELGVVQIAGAHGRHVDQLLEQPLVVAPGPAPHDGLHLHVVTRQHFQRRAAHGRGLCVHMQHGVLNGAVEQHRVEFVIVLDVGLLLAALDLVQRRLRYIDVTPLDQQRDLPVEERQQQCADVTAIDIRIGHDNDAVIAQLIDVEFFPADAAAERGDQRADLHR